MTSLSVSRPVTSAETGINVFQSVKHLPSWLPGAGFQRFGKEGRELRLRYADETFNMVFDQVVSGIIDLH